MTLKQQSFLQGTKSFEINDDMLRCAFQSLGRDYRFDVPLADIRPNFEEYRSVAWSLYLVGIIALGFVVFQFRTSARLDLSNMILIGVYAVIAIGALAAASKRSGQYLIIKIGGDVPRSIWILRQAPSRSEVDGFLQELKTAIRQSREPDLKT
tara:strand:- start:95 stop:553 length:459 start_codon:yes stop_codon:yes gene_type:complete